MKRLIPLYLLLLAFWWPGRIHAHIEPAFEAYLVDFTQPQAYAAHFNADVVPGQGLMPLIQRKEGYFRSVAIAITLENPVQFQTLSATIQVADYAPEALQLNWRFSSDGQTWLPWEEMHHQQTWQQGDSLLHSDPVFLSSEMRYYQLAIVFPVRENGGLPVRVRSVRFDMYTPGSMSLVSPEQLVFRPIVNANPDPVCGCEAPRYARRLDWNCPDGQSPSCAQPAYAPVSHIGVYASVPTDSIVNWTAAVHALWYHHTRTLGRCDIGYNWLIDPQGVLYEGRGGGNDVLGDASCISDVRLMSICLLGSFDGEAPTPAALNTLRQLVAWKSCDADLNPDTARIHLSSGLALPVVFSHNESCTAPRLEDLSVETALPDLRMVADSTVGACAFTTDVADALLTHDRLYPNPSEGRFVLDVELTRPLRTPLTVLGLDGREVYRQQLDLPAGRHVIPFDLHLPRGLYVVRADRVLHRLWIAD
ncbi:MAG: hypothetical protein OHK0039_03780 [Bacteroidia bacterium]